jgi:hypothetical protein
MIHARHQTDCNPLTAPAEGIERATQMRICEYIRNDRAFPQSDGALERFGETCSFPFPGSSSWRFFQPSCPGGRVLSTGTLPRRLRRY